MLFMVLEIVFKIGYLLLCFILTQWFMSSMGAIGLPTYKWPLVTFLEQLLKSQVQKFIDILVSKD